MLLLLLNYVVLRALWKIDVYLISTLVLTVFIIVIWYLIRHEVGELEVTANCSSIYKHTNSYTTKQHNKTTLNY